MNKLSVLLLTALLASCGSPDPNPVTLPPIVPATPQVAPQVSSAASKGEELSESIERVSQAKDDLGISLLSLPDVVDVNSSPNFLALYNQLTLDYEELTKELTSTKLNMAELTKINISLVKLATEKDSEVIDLRSSSESLAENNLVLIERVKDRDVKITKLEDSLKSYKTIRNFVGGTIGLLLLVSVLRFKLIG